MLGTAVSDLEVVPKPETGTLWTVRYHLVDEATGATDPGAWIAVAAKWADQDYHGGYDLLNEPYPGAHFASCANTEGCPVFDTQYLQPMHEHVMRGIRTLPYRMRAHCAVVRAVLRHARPRPRHRPVDRPRPWRQISAVASRAW